MENDIELIDLFDNLLVNIGNLYEEVMIARLLEDWMQGFI